MAERCPECGEEFTYLGLHWDRGKCDYPALGSERRQIVTGTLLGDGYIMRNKNPRLRLSMTNHVFLEWIDEQFGVLASGGVTTHRKAAERAKRDRQTGFNPKATAEGYSDTYEWHTRGLPELQEFANWYDSGVKVPPDSLSLTPLTLKLWYVCDGSLEVGRLGQPRLKIAATDFIKRGVNVSGWFQRVGFDPTITKTHIQFGHEASEQLLKYMGKPIPGFRNKW